MDRLRRAGAWCRDRVTDLVDVVADIVDDIDWWS